LAKKKFIFSDFNRLNPSKLDKVLAYIDDLAADFMREWRRQRIMETQAILSRHMQYKHIKYVNSN